MNFKAYDEELSKALVEELKKTFPEGIDKIWDPEVAYLNGAYRGLQKARKIQKKVARKGGNEITSLIVIAFSFAAGVASMAYTLLVLKFL